MTSELTTGTIRSIPVPSLQLPTRMSKQAIICVDDEQTVLQSLKAELRDAFGREYTIELAEGGADALELFEELLEDGYGIPVVISDYIMPEMKGDELLKRIHELSPKTLKILLTGQADVEAVANAVNYAKLYRYIAKPWQAEDLNLTVSEALHSYWQERQLSEKTLQLQKANQALEEANQQQARAIAQLQENEHRLQQFLDGIPVGVMIFDVAGMLSYLNAQARQLLDRGFERNATIEQIPEIYQLYRVGSSTPYPAADLPCARALQGESVRADDLEVRRSDKTIPLEVWGTPIYDARGRISYAIAALADISERQDAEAERQQFIADLFEVNTDLQLALDKQVEIAEATARFVPHQFLQLLDKESIVDVTLGESVEQEMSIMFADIRSFTTLSERMSLEDNFQFINAYLSHMEPAIIENQGFIDKYIGDAIMALFHRSADDALRAGITMLQRLVEFNVNGKHDRRPAIAIGIGINTGRSMLGTVGGQSRMDSTVISDAVNLAARLEGLTKDYGVPLLISQQTWLNLHDPEQYAIRFIDKVQVKGKSEVVSVYEVFDADDETLKQGKLATKPAFERAWLHFQEGNYQKAAQLFEDCLAQNPGDRVVRIYLERCRSGMSSGL
ncbi:MAG: adenylate/guanylate cyclase domain-containing protein [Cyanobacteriota bacterium]|nr:adenylate/guanylate cyclase domain-containing protein [Cyanobacteriota bacterium]